MNVWLTVFPVTEAVPSPKFQLYPDGSLIVAGETAVDADASKLKLVVIVPLVGDTVKEAAGSAEPTLTS